MFSIFCKEANIFHTVLVYVGLFPFTSETNLIFLVDLNNRSGIFCRCPSAAADCNFDSRRVLLSGVGLQVVYHLELGRDKLELGLSGHNPVCVSVFGSDGRDGCLTKLRGSLNLLCLGTVIQS